ncbi:putative pectinesterase/pectinesterase inhibitor 38 [Dichanthelium oligosanthes]|uniref:Pectinesterase n=1 Tax=Dichanthelium oligosanthes TaxID=888268 RepID=A0A1E5UYS8_9POAL|nr:putative pectinesterase/pectinesterase inhibitor 38 [Dichanthelium oligosanthes]
MRQVVALRSNSNKPVVYRCSIEGFEDTLYAENGLQLYLYLESTIMGTVDFVFGNAQAMFQKFSLLVRRPPEDKHNVLTAQAATTPVVSPASPSTCAPSKRAPGVNLDGVETFLGRPYRNLSHVAFISSFLGRVVSARGWVPWDKNHEVEETTRTVQYREFGNVGPGAKTEARVSWLGFQRLRGRQLHGGRLRRRQDWVPEQIKYDHAAPPEPEPQPPMPPRAA